MDELLKITEKFTSAGDIVAILLAGVTGFILDAAFDVMGFLASGETAVVTALGVLGIKKAADLLLAKRRAKRRADALRLLLQQDPQLLLRLQRECEFLNSGVINADQFQARLDILVNACRERAETMPLLEK